MTREKLCWFASMIVSEMGNGKRCASTLAPCHIVDSIQSGLSGNHLLLLNNLLNF
nr:Uncharacterised protein [Klebsiella pneumoniae]